jgi:hypothetical protein
LPASKAAPRASTRWPARCCPWKHRAPTGWPTRFCRCHRALFAARERRHGPVCEELQSHSPLRKA